MERDLYSGAGAYVLLRGEEWAFAHDLLPDAWIRVSGSGLTVSLRPWAKLPTGMIWVPRVRAFAAPWEWEGAGPDPRDLPRDPNGEPMVLAGPVRCTARGAWAHFRLLRGTAAVEAAQDAIRARLCARMLLKASHAFVCGAWEARHVVPRLEWTIREHDRRIVLVAEHDGRTLVAADEWVAAAASFEEAVAELDRADEDEPPSQDY